MSIFEKASRLKLRFTTPVGVVSTEDLWYIKPSVLAEMEEVLLKEVSNYGQTTRKSRASATVAQTQQKLRLEIITHVLDTLESESEERNAKAARQERNRQILEIIAQKQQANLHDKSIEDLQKMLEEN